MEPPTSPAGAWRALREGNARFVAGALDHPHHDAVRRAELTGGQQPFAAVLGCADSRTSPEVLFDRGLGDLFVVRTAGQAVDGAVLGSLEYAVGHLHTPLVVVLGHSSCGAVAATAQARVAGRAPGGFVRDLVERVGVSLLGEDVTADTVADPAALDALSDVHVRATCHLLVERSAVIAAAVDAGTCAVVGLGYRLADGTAPLLEVVGDVGESLSAGTVEPAAS